MATLEERVSALESTYGHLATKADLAALEARLEARIGSVETQVHAMEARLIKWFLATMIGAVAATSAVVIALSQLVG